MEFAEQIMLDLINQGYFIRGLSPPVRFKIACTFFRKTSRENGSEI